MRNIKEFQVWKEEYLTSLKVDGMDEFDEELFLLNNKCENINDFLFVLEDWFDNDENIVLNHSAQTGEDPDFYE